MNAIITEVPNLETDQLDSEYDKYKDLVEETGEIWRMNDLDSYSFDFERE